MTAVIVISRGLARSVRALARKCISGRPRGPAPPVVFESRAGTLTACVRTADAILVHATPTRGGDGVLVVPMAVLDAVEGAGDDPVELAAAGAIRGEARWIDRGGPRTHLFEAVLPGTKHRPPDPPGEWHPAPSELLAALDECGRTTAREPCRYALTRVQVRGMAGQVVGTDGRTALIWDGLALPFTPDVLVPAVPVFGCRELTREAAVRVGRTPTEMVVAAGSWRVHLPVDTDGRFPDLASVMPRAAGTVAGIDDRDAAELLAALPGLLGADAEHHPVTLDLAGGVVVRARDGATGEVHEVRMLRSPATGPPVRVAVNRRVLARALALGCVTVRVSTPDRPVAFEGRNKTLVVAALDPDLAVAPETTAAATPHPQLPERRTTVRHETNEHPPAPPDPPAADPPDLLTAAEELRAAVADTLVKAGRLVAAVKAGRRHQKVLSQVWSNLKALNLGPGGGP
ncbi:hypothetical protein [Urbifossiella limnaea]|uniref:hypothetical protein n=1 Tax=Urbifossiella limnaea TaxID=2528023 RepID=UPI0011A1FD69|nr:hypothetical protein [Urbifossiella limnaea]